MPWDRCSGGRAGSCTPQSSVSLSPAAGRFFSMATMHGSAWAPTTNTLFTIFVAEFPSIIRLVSLTSGTRLGHYQVQSAIGAGGMGEVYKARDTRLDRVVAIKVLPAHLSSDPQLRERFEREARVI